MLDHLVVRPAKLTDLDAIEAMALTALPGMTNLPKDRILLHKKLMQSEQAFESRIGAPQGEQYLFVLEDTQKDTVVGVAGIVSSIGCEEPFYSFNIQPVSKESRSLKTQNSLDVLRLSSVRKGPSEIGSLYLKSNYRQKGIGRFLSLARFLFMAMHPERFHKMVIAEMRGVSDDFGNCPFYDYVTQHFFKIPFSDAILNAAKSMAFVEELLPKYPIYLDLLPDEARKVVGRAHVYTLPALRILQKEGFHISDSIDIFDGGPKVSAYLSDIRAIAHSHVGSVTHFNEEISEYKEKSVEDLTLVASGDLKDFKVSCGVIKHLNQQEIVLPEYMQSLLNCKERETIRHTMLYPPKMEKSINGHSLEELPLDHEHHVLHPVISKLRKSGKSLFLERVSDWHKSNTTVQREIDGRTHITLD